MSRLHGAWIVEAWPCGVAGRSCDIFCSTVKSNKKNHPHINEEVIELD